jgi:hypothetical protein
MINHEVTIAADARGLDEGIFFDAWSQSGVPHDALEAAFLANLVGHDEYVNWVAEKSLDIRQDLFFRFPKYRDIINEHSAVIDLSVAHKHESRRRAASWLLRGLQEIASPLSLSLEATLGEPTETAVRRMGVIDITTLPGFKGRHFNSRKRQLFPGTGLERLVTGYNVVSPMSVQLEHSAQEYLVDSGIMKAVDVYNSNEEQVKNGIRMIRLLVVDTGFSPSDLDALAHSHAKKLSRINTLKETRVQHMLPGGQQVSLPILGSTATAEPSLIGRYLPNF